MSKRDTILILMPTLFVGGSELQVRYIIEGLEETGNKTIVLVENGEPEDELNANYIEQHSDVSFIFLKQHTFLKNEKNKKNKIKSLICISKWILMNGKKEQIKWAMFTNLTGLLVVPICRLMGIKVLFNERNPGIKMCDNMLKRFCLKMCNKVVANSKSAAEYMSKVLNRNVECINNGVNISEKDKSLKTESDNTILVPARITHIKNQMVLAKAMNLLKDLNLKVFLAGHLEETDYADEIKQYIQKYNLQEQVIFLGYVNNIQDLYNQARLVVLPSREEGTPNVMLEAYLNKKLCLASDIIMNRNATCDERILFNVDDDQELADKIRWILNLSNNEKDDLLQKNYYFVKEHYSLSVMQKKYLAIFDN